MTEIVRPTFLNLPEAKQARIIEAASAREAAAQDGSPLTTLIEDLGEISREHDVAYANAKPSSGEIVNQAACEEQLGDLLRRVHENVHALQHVA